MNSTTNLAKLPASYNVPTAFKDAKESDIMEDKVQDAPHHTHFAKRNTLEYIS